MEAAPPPRDLPPPAVPIHVPPAPPLAIALHPVHPLPPDALVSSPSPSSPSSPALRDSFVRLATELSDVTGLPEPPSAPPPPDYLEWLHGFLQRLHDHLAALPPPSHIAISAPGVGAVPPTFPPAALPPASLISAALNATRRAKRRSPSSDHSDDADGLDGVEDARVDSEDDMTDALLSRRTSRAKSGSSFLSSSLLRNQRKRSSAYSASVPDIAELRLDHDGLPYSARSSQAYIDGRPQLKLPLGSPANSYLTQMSSWKSLGYGEANRLHRDYSRIFKDDDDGAPLVGPDESAIQIAGGDLYTCNTLSNRWLVSHKIGEGGYATVRMATRTPSAPCASGPESNVAAIKIISKRCLDLYNEKMVSREVFSFRLLDMAGGHDNIVEMYEVCEDKDNVYLVMEYLSGGELFARISERGQYTERDAANLVVSMLASLAFCHRLNLTHRDVKPENFVFLSRDEDSVDVKLTDFGIAHYSEDPCALCKTLCGTPLYVAPEVLLRQPYGPEADLWSLGVIVYIMLVGYPPFDDNDLVQLVKKIKYWTVKFEGPEWALISEEGKDFLRSLLDKDASNRMTAPQALEHDWLRNNCQAATKNILTGAQTKIKSFVSRKRWRAAIQGVKAVNRIKNMISVPENEFLPDADSVEPVCVRGERSFIFDDLDDISAERVQVVNVQGVDESSVANITDLRAANDTASSSSSSEDLSVSMHRPPPMQTRNPVPSVIRTSATSELHEDTRSLPTPSGSRASVVMERPLGSMPPLRGLTTYRPPPPPIPTQQSSAGKRRVTSAMDPNPGALMAAQVTGHASSNGVLLATDPAFESSDGESEEKFEVKDWRRRMPTAGKTDSGAVLGRTTTSPVVGGGGENDSGRVGRTLTRFEAGVVRKMSSHARRLVGRRKKADTSGEDRMPVVVQMGEHRKQKRFPWFR